VVRAAAALAVALGLLSGCAPRLAVQPEVRTADVTVGDVRLRVRHWPGDEKSARRVIRALETAVPRAQRWGPMAAPITITIHPSHDALVSAVQRQGYDWLRAWARYQTIDLQSPRTWGLLAVPDRKIEELLAHELTHCAMYQVAGSDVTWMFKEIPRWFSEGIATVTAGQGYRYGGLAEIKAFYQEKLPGSGDGETGRRVPRMPVAFHGDPIIDPDPIYMDQSDVVYGAAHHAAEFLFARYGADRVRKALDLMGKGQRFPAAFKEAIGITDAEFASDFRRYVVWEGWKR